MSATTISLVRRPVRDLPACGLANRAVDDLQDLRPC